MAVEILILSGARQGERIVFDGREFSAGADPACEVYFDAGRDRAVFGRSAEFRLEEDGWQLRCTGGEAFVNHQPVAGWTHIRSGDVVRMSDAGPDFSFGIVTGQAAWATRAPVVEPTPKMRQATSPPVVAAELDKRTVPLSPDLTDDSPTVVSVLASNEPQNSLRARRAGANPPWALWAVGGLVIGILTLLMVRLAFFPSTEVVAVNPPVNSTTPGDPPVPPVLPPENWPEKDAPTVEKERLPVDIAAQLQDAVFLIQVEKSGQSWPFATCVAVADDTLLTTAREAAQLAKWRAEGSFKIWVTRPADGFKVGVRDFRINGVYASITQKPNDWIYVDLGLLTVTKKLPKVAPLASPEELAALEDGAPVACFGFTHEGEKATSFDKFEPRLTSGKVFLVTVCRDLPEHPRLLHVKAEIPKNAYGSPIVNQEGKVVGIYGEAAAPPGTPAQPDAPSLKNMHYVTVVHLEMLNLWLRDRNDKMWLPPVAPRTPEPTQDSP